MKTIKSVATIILAIFAFSTMNAQISLGLRVGGNSSWLATPSLSSSLSDNLKSYRAWELGVVSEIKVTDNFSIQPELNYTEKGFRINQSTGIFNVDIPVGINVTTKLRYVELPVLAKYQFGDNLVKPYIIAGPTFGYAMSGALITNANLLINVKLNDIPINLDAVKGERFEVGAMAGAGVKFDLGNTQLFTDLRYARGFTDINSLPAIDLNIKNQRIALSVGALFAF